MVKGNKTPLTLCMRYNHKMGQRVYNNPKKPLNAAFKPNVLLEMKREKSIKQNGMVAHP